MNHPCPLGHKLCTHAERRGYRGDNPNVYAGRFAGRQAHRHSDGKWYVLRIPIPTRVGRPRLGKTHVRSPEAKERRNAARKQRTVYTKYRYSHTDILYSVLDAGQVPEGRLAYHRARYAKAGRPWVERPLPWGFKLKHQRKYTLPILVVEALYRIYSVTPVCSARREKKGTVRTPRARTRSQTIERLQKELQSLEDPWGSDKSKLARYNVVNQILQEEIELRARRNFEEDHTKIWSDTYRNSRFFPYKGTKPVGGYFS